MKFTTFIALTLVGESALAQGVTETESVMSSAYLLRLILGLLFILALIFVLARFVSRFNLNQGAKDGALRIVAGLPTGARDRIVLLQVGEEQVLLGLTPGRIEKLHTLSVPVEIGRQSEVNSGFAVKLQTALKGGKST